MPSLFSGEPLSFTHDCTDDRSIERLLEAPLISALENGLDFFGLRLLTPLRPIYFSLFFRFIELQPSDARHHLAAKANPCYAFVN
jgi:hypothetical protein